MRNVMKVGLSINRNLIDTLNYVAGPQDDMSQDPEANHRTRIESYSPALARPHRIPKI